MIFIRNIRTRVAASLRSSGRLSIVAVKLFYRVLPLFLLIALTFNFYLLNELRRQERLQDKDLTEAFAEAFQAINGVSPAIEAVRQEIEDKPSQADVEMMIQDAIDNSEPVYVSAPAAAPSPSLKLNASLDELQKRLKERDTETRLQDLERKTNPYTPDWAR